ncbi:uncharacterized protein LOC130735993 [Lotus japonicus]|uniref:uncharacterized protein LOC130735993 n=1 Tax=Lotus japonicus TaxID=34305 RepID=UPI002586971C|nr:uncharacterized protein LOC130735993 [Lotus japonicus]
MKGALLSTLTSATLVEGKDDKWVWMANEEGHYSVKSAFQLLQGLTIAEPILEFETLWKCFAPSNTLAFGWKTLWGRIQTRTNLNRRGILHNGDSLTCAFCLGEEETLEHLLLHFSFSSQVWQKCYRWLNILTVLPATCGMHFLQHGGEFMTANKRQGAKSMWLAIVWTLWLSRNKVIFQNGPRDVEKVFDSAQLRAWNWLRVKNNNFSFTPYEWISNTRLCLGSL